MSHLRADRQLALMFAHLVPKGGERAAQRAVPILMYHSISENAEVGLSPYYRVCTAPRVFAEQMRFLFQTGYRATDLRSVWERLSRGESDLGKIAVLTFDDGFRDFHTAAFPILAQYGFSATMFLPTAFIDDRRREFLGRECLTWEEVRGLGERGIHFGSHTVHHHRLVDLGWPQVEEEVRESKVAMERVLGAPVDCFAFPFAFPQERKGFVSKLETVLRQTGYRCCVTTKVGRARLGQNSFFLERLPVNSDDDVALFAAKLAGAYDWMGDCQAVVRQVKRWFRRDRVDGAQDRVLGAH